MLHIRVLLHDVALLCCLFLSIRCNGECNNVRKRKATISTTLVSMDSPSALSGVIANDSHNGTSNAQNQLCTEYAAVMEDWMQWRRLHTVGVRFEKDAPDENRRKSNHCDQYHFQGVLVVDVNATFGCPWLPGDVLSVNVNGRIVFSSGPLPELEHGGGGKFEFPWCVPNRGISEILVDITRSLQSVSSTGRTLHLCRGWTSVHPSFLRPMETCDQLQHEVDDARVDILIPRIVPAMSRRMYAAEAVLEVSAQGLGLSDFHISVIHNGTPRGPEVEVHADKLWSCSMDARFELPRSSASKRLKGFAFRISISVTTLMVGRHTFSVILSSESQTARSPQVAFKVLPLRSVPPIVMGQAPVPMDFPHVHKDELASLYTDTWSDQESTSRTPREMKYDTLGGIHFVSGRRTKLSLCMLQDWMRMHSNGFMDSTQMQMNGDCSWEATQNDKSASLSPCSPTLKVCHEMIDGVFGYIRTSNVFGAFDAINNTLAAPFWKYEPSMEMDFSVYFVRIVMLSIEAASVDSYWFSYLRNLPTKNSAFSALNNVPYWSLKSWDTAVSRFSPSLNFTLESWHNDWQKFQRVITSLDQGRLSTEFMGLDRLRWAVAIFISRCFGVDSRIFLWPYVDFFSHASRSKVLRPTKVRSNGMNRSFIGLKGILAHRGLTWPSGEELFVSYGQKPNMDLLGYYGFVIRDNANDVTVVSITDLIQGCTEAGLWCRFTAFVRQGIIDKNGYPSDALWANVRSFVGDTNSNSKSIETQINSTVLYVSAVRRMLKRVEDGLIWISDNQPNITADSCHRTTYSHLPPKQWAFLLHKSQRKLSLASLTTNDVRDWVAQRRRELSILPSTDAGGPSPFWYILSEEQCILLLTWCWVMELPIADESYHSSWNVQGKIISQPIDNDVGHPLNNVFETIAPNSNKTKEGLKKSTNMSVSISSNVTVEPNPARQNTVEPCQPYDGVITHWKRWRQLRPVITKFDFDRQTLDVGTLSSNLTNCNFLPDDEFQVSVNGDIVDTMPMKLRIKEDNIVKVTVTVAVELAQRQDPSTIVVDIIRKLLDTNRTLHLCRGWVLTSPLSVMETMTGCQQHGTTKFGEPSKSSSGSDFIDYDLVQISVRLPAVVPTLLGVMFTDSIHVEVLVAGVPEPNFSVAVNFDDSVDAVVVTTSESSVFFCDSGVITETEGRRNMHGYAWSGNIRLPFAVAGQHSITVRVLGQNGSRESKSTVFDVVPLRNLAPKVTNQVPEASDFPDVKIHPEELATLYSSDWDDTQSKRPNTLGGMSFTAGQRSTLSVCLFEDWANTMIAGFHQHLHLKTRGDCEWGSHKRNECDISIYAKRDFAIRGTNDAIVAESSMELMLGTNASTSLSQLGPIWLNGIPEQCHGATVSATTCLILMLSIETTSIDSVWYPLLRLLPGVESVQPSSDFCEQETSSPGFSYARKVKIDRDLEYSAKQLTQSLPWVLHRLPLAWRHPERLKWAYNVVMRYGYLTQESTNDEKDSLTRRVIGLIVFFNHASPTGNIIVLTRRKLKDQYFSQIRLQLRQGLDVNDGLAIRKGAELFTSYGSQSNAVLLANFGFTLRNNSNDRIPVHNDDIAEACKTLSCSRHMTALRTQSLFLDYSGRPWLQNGNGVIHDSDYSPQDYAHLPLDVYTSLVLNLLDRVENGLDWFALRVPKDPDDTHFVYQKPAVFGSKAPHNPTSETMRKWVAYRRHQLGVKIPLAGDRCPSPLWCVLASEQCILVLALAGAMDATMS